MMSGRNPIVIIVAPKPRALWIQEPARTTSMTNKIVELNIHFPFYTFYTFLNIVVCAQEIMTR